jgi:hypothetical protein
MSNDNGMQISFGRDPDDKAWRVRKLVHEALLAKAEAGEIPTNNRFLFYEAEQRGEATKPRASDTRTHRRRNVGWPPGEQDVIDASMWLREVGPLIASEREPVPWWWLTDETRRVHAWAYAPTVAEFMRDRLAAATISPWGRCKPPLIICESKATAAVLRDAVSAYVCPITGTGGQVGGFLRTEVVPLLLEGDRVLYVGDLDKSGGDIERNTRRVLERACASERRQAVDAIRRERGTPNPRPVLEWQRIAITPEQATGINPILKPDRRERGGRLRECWEAEALGQAQLVLLVREALDALLPEPLDRVQEREDAEREAWRKRLEAPEGGDSR